MELFKDISLSYKDQKFNQSHSIKSEHSQSNRLVCISEVNLCELISFINLKSHVQNRLKWYKIDILIGKLLMAQNNNTLINISGDIQQIKINTYSMFLTYLTTSGKYYNNITTLIMECVVKPSSSSSGSSNSTTLSTHIQ